MIENPTIIIADNNENHVQWLSEALLSLKCRILRADTGEELLLKVIQGPDIIILNTVLPGLSIFRLIANLKANADTRGIPIIVITGHGGQREKLKVFELGANEFLRIPFDPIELMAKVKSLLLIKEYHDQLRDSHEKLMAQMRRRIEDVQAAYEALVSTSQQLKTIHLETIYRLAIAAECRDEDTAFHIQRMSNYSAIIARNYGLNENQVEDILYASPMHDIGKIGVPDGILLKPGKLSEDEWIVMKQHTVIGAKILSGSSSQLISIARVIALTHHERVDGTGYPNAIKGKDIPIEGRIVALADMFDAASSDRVYKKGLPNQDVYKIIRDLTGKFYDEQVVEAFFNGIDQIEEMQRRYK